MGSKTIVISLDDDAAADLDDLSAHLGVNKRALTQAAIELWSSRWHGASGLADFARHYQITVIGPETTLWEVWVGRARRIQAEHRSRRQANTARRSVMIRVDPEPLAVARQMAAAIGPMMLTALLQAIMEYWVAYWEDVEQNPTLEWPDDDDPPRWWALWVRWQGFSRQVAGGSGRPCEAVMLRLDLDVAEGLDRIGVAVGSSMTALFQGMIQMWAEGWADEAPTVEWTSAAPPPSWWSGWLGVVDRAREIRTDRRGG